MRVRTGKIEYNLFALAPHGALNFIRASAHAVVADIIFEADGVFANGHGDERFHGAMVAGQQLLRCRDIDIITKAGSHFDDAARGDPA